MSRSGGYTISPQTMWRNAGNITVEHAVLGVTGRDYITAEAIDSTDIVTIQPDGKPYAMLLRFRSDGTEEDDSILQMYAARGKDDYIRIAQLTVVQGAQIDSGSIYFVDTITPASEYALFAGVEHNLTDMIAHYYIRTLGFDRFLFVCSDLDTTTIYIDVAYLYE